jgi:gluconate 2-dehydrogenase alpha chain
VKRLPAVDAVIIGGGFAGLLMAKELGGRTALSVAVLERGGRHDATEYFTGMDELDYNVRFRLMQDYSRDTVTLRHTLRDRALPIRQLGSFLPGTGIGGSAEHWGATCPRFTPDSFELLSKTIERYGPGKLPENHSIQDWGITYDELEPYYARYERLLGVSGKAGNIRGTKIDGGNIFEGWRSTEYPMPPMKVPYFSSLFREAARSLGYHPYASPAAINSINYENPDGVARPSCFYCGFCGRFGCMISAKAQPSNMLIPVIEKQENVSIRTGVWVRRIVHEVTKPNGMVRGVTYVDTSGEESFQPANVVFLASWTLSNTRLLYLSGMGEPYDPLSGKGTLGRNLTHQVSFTAAQAFFEPPLNNFMGAGGVGTRLDDFDGDVFDHSDLSFIRGGVLSAMNEGTQPIAEFGTVPHSIKSRWGAEWKRQSISHYDRVGNVGFSGEHIAYKDNFMDLDPTYKDSFGDPLLRLTLDWQDNERKMVEFIIPKGIELAHAMGAKEINSGSASMYDHYDVRRSQGTHIQGGTIMSTSPDKGVLNPFLQHWDFPNLFVLGGSAFPQNASANPTPTLLALTYRTADAVIDRYLRKPGPLA